MEHRKGFLEDVVNAPGQRREWASRLLKRLTVGQLLGRSPCMTNMRPLFHTATFTLFLYLLAVLGGCSRPSRTTMTSTTESSQWVVAWGASPENAQPGLENPGGAEQTFRSFFYPTVAGVEERVHLSNVFGTTPITVGAARLSAAGGSTPPAVDSTRDVPLTFSGATSITIPAGGSITSDSVKINYAFGEKLAVSLYVQGTFPALTQHESQVNTNYSAAANTGNSTRDTLGTSFTTTNTEWYLLTGVDVYGPYGGTVALFGSSSIDGHASNYGDTNSYPVANVPIASQDNDRPSDWLARLLIAAGYNLGVLNAGAIGDPAGEDARTAQGGAVAGIDRIQRDVLTQAGIKTVVIYFGGVDLRGDCVSAANVQASLSNMIAQAYAARVRVILATIPPSEYCTNPLIAGAALIPSANNPYAGDINPGPENSGSTQRNLVNTWIRSTGLALPGVVAIADFDKVLADPTHPDFMIPEYNSGDNFHPNGTGYGVQSAAIPLISIQ